MARQIQNWRLMSLHQRLAKTGGRLIKHARYYWLLPQENRLTRRLFGACCEGLRRSQHEWGMRQFLILRFFRGRGKDFALKNLAGPLHTDGGRCTLSVSREGQNEESS